MSSAPRRTASTSSRPARSAAQAELPHRTRSVAVRPSNHSQPPPPPAQYAHSKTASHDHRPPSNYAAFDGVGRPDGDAKARRDRDVSAERPATAWTESTRRHQRTSSMQPRENELAPVDSVPVSASGPLGPTSAPSQPKRRTTITTPTGNWALGKTIGAGSMGKVKLAKNIETGEQVIIPNPRCFPFFFCPRDGGAQFRVMTRTLRSRAMDLVRSLLIWALSRCIGCRQDRPSPVDRGTQVLARDGAGRSLQGNSNCKRGCHRLSNQPSIHLRYAGRGSNYVPLVHAV